MSELHPHGALAGERYRVIISTDIGGSDPDDFQSLVHYLLYSDLFDTEGLISSPWGNGRISDILTVIDCYEKDYPYLKTWSEHYPSPDKLRRITKQGTVDFAPWKGWSEPTEGSEWIISCARRPDPRPLYLLVWGLLEDLAQALHDAPDILPKLRVNYIGGPNKKWGANAYAYIRENFPNLWMIEDNSTYRGWFMGGETNAPWGNASFVSTFAAGHGAMGNYFATHLGGKIKMGDTPTVAWLLKGQPEFPERDSWGGSFEPVTDMPQTTRCHPVTADSPMEVFAVTEVIFSGPEISPVESPVFTMSILGQDFDGFYTGNGEYKIRFIPKKTGDFPYETHSTLPELDGLTGIFRAVPEDPALRRNPCGNLKHWWSDRLDPKLSEGPDAGAKTVNQWRKEYLADFAKRLEHCMIQKRGEHDE